MKKQLLIGVCSLIAILGLTWVIHAITIQITPEEVKQLEELNVHSLKLGSAGEEVEPTSASGGATSVSGNVVHLTDYNDDLAVGDNDTSAEFYFDTSAGDLDITGDLTAGTLTMTGAASFGDMSGVDATFNSVTTTGWLLVGGSASTTDYLAIGSDAQDDDDILYFDARNENLTWDDDPGEFTLTDDLNITGNATTSGETVFGSVGLGAGNTTTIQFGDNGTVDTEGLCLKFFSGGQTIYCYFIGTTLTCSADSCE